MNVYKNYTPENPEFFTEEEKQNLQLPAVLELGNTEDEIIENLKADFTFTQPEGKKEFKRLFDEYEIEELEKTLLEIVKYELPHAQDNYQRVKEETKQMLEEAKSKLSTAQDRQSDYTKKIKYDRVEMNIIGEKVYRIPAHGKYHYYVLLNGKLRLAKVENIKESEQGDLFETFVRNQAASPKNEAI